LSPKLPPPEEKLSERLVLALTKSDRQRLQELAELRGEPEAACARACIRSVLDVEMPPSPLDRPLPLPADRKLGDRAGLKKLGDARKADLLASAEHLRASAQRDLVEARELRRQAGPRPKK
jgi:hypothetical protein